MYTHIYVTLIQDQLTFQAPPHTHGVPQQHNVSHAHYARVATEALEPLAAVTGLGPVAAAPPPLSAATRHVPVQFFLRQYVRLFLSICNSLSFMCRFLLLVSGSFPPRLCFSLPPLVAFLSQRRGRTERGDRCV